MTQFILFAQNQTNITIHGSSCFVLISGSITFLMKLPAMSHAGYAQTETCFYMHLNKTQKDFTCIQQKKVKAHVSYLADYRQQTVNDSEYHSARQVQQGSLQPPFKVKAIP